MALHGLVELAVDILKGKHEYGIEATRPRADGIGNPWDGQDGIDGGRELFWLDGDTSDEGVLPLQLPMPLVDLSTFLEVAPLKDGKQLQGDLLTGFEELALHFLVTLLELGHETFDHGAGVGPHVDIYNVAQHSRGGAVETLDLGVHFEQLLHLLPAPMAEQGQDPMGQDVAVQVAAEHCRGDVEVAADLLLGLQVAHLAEQVHQPMEEVPTFLLLLLKSVIQQKDKTGDNADHNAGRAAQPRLGVPLLIDGKTSFIQGILVGDEVAAECQFEMDGPRTAHSIVELKCGCN